MNTQPVREATPEEARALVQAGYMGPEHYRELLQKWAAEAVESRAVVLRRVRAH